MLTFFVRCHLIQCFGMTWFIKCFLTDDWLYVEIKGSYGGLGIEMHLLLFCFHESRDTVLPQQRWEKKKKKTTHDSTWSSHVISPFTQTLFQPPACRSQQDTQLYSRKRSTMLSTQYIIQAYKSPQRRLSVCYWLRGPGEGKWSCNTRRTRTSWPEWLLVFWFPPGAPLWPVPVF